MTKELLGSLEKNRIYQFDVLEGLKLVPNNSIDLIIADPPYFGVVKDKWDNQWGNNYSKFNEWISSIILEFERVLKVNGTIYFYGWFNNMLPLYEAINKLFYLRQNITIHKGLKSIAGRTSSKLKMFPTATEYLWVLTKQDTVGRLKDGSSIIDPIHKVLQEGIKEKSLKMKDINKIWGHPHNSGIAGHYFRDKSQPAFITKEKYEQLISYGCKFKKTWEQLKIMYENDRIKFNLPRGVTDVWDIDFYKDEKYGHSTQKPIELCERIIQASSNENDNLLIPFVGSGSECVASRKLNRNFIGFEIDTTYIEMANMRLDSMSTEK
ncbi:site-specific DNA-methyltransferase [Bacillus subtilis]|uniref:DNA-methyltransferase n=1 Tax=Bacillus subtilis TaxID=1423 RepID=UPI001F598646|nr:site-specific DNA-methyltransferase [Bacillus subtilis]UNL88012.1 site-specific DNA-methyltransferase [Bacillus subtilis]